MAFIDHNELHAPAPRIAIDFSTGIDFDTTEPRYTLLPIPGVDLGGCPWCYEAPHAKACRAMRLADLLSAHATDWWRDIEADDYVAQVNATYAAYEAAGGNDAHYDAHWRSMSDAAKDATKEGA